LQARKLGRKLVILHNPSFASMQNEYAKLQILHNPSFASMQNEYAKLQILHHVFQSLKFKVLHLGKCNAK
jgi:hypothetical protein